MKQILCYGDSNTWGFTGTELQRYPYDVRWTGRLAGLLGREYLVIEEGLCGRTIAVEDNVQPYRSGIRYLTPCLMSHMPLECLIVMLGTNDTKCRYRLSPREIGIEMREMMQTIKSLFHWMQADPKILLVAPPQLSEDMEENYGMDETSVKKSRQFATIFRSIAEEYETAFLDAGSIVKELQEDGCHLSEKGHEQLAAGVYQKLKEIL